MAAADEYSTTSHVLQLCLALQDRLEKVEKEVQSLKGEILALKLVLEEKKTFASVVKDGEVEVDSWKVVAASATKCTLKRHSAVDLNNRFSTLSDECEEGASNTTSATPSVSVERGSSAGAIQMTHKLLNICDIPISTNGVQQEWVVIEHLPALIFTIITEGQDCVTPGRSAQHPHFSDLGTNEVNQQHHYISVFTRYQYFFMALGLCIT
ncbi:hypothetical protein Hamer_G010024 [Homarus americanus]|uniref:Uncharacterized protein n=1 Tax=Homarus americanus TaxID=6706 RepID=A0A8J5JFI0_HOMAM|nr:hypothetical protein Hamer_G010024 [Homarus americanus]